MLAYMIPGEAREYHLELSNRMADRFKQKPISERIDPHFTLKSPFETENVTDIAEITRAFTQKEYQETVRLGGFEHFNSRVIFVDAHAPKQTHMQLRRLQDKLRTVPWLDFWGNEFPLTLHATLVRARNPQQGKEMLAYLKKEQPKYFDLLIDNVTLLQKYDGKWHTVERFPIA